MPALPPVADVLRVTLKHTISADHDVLNRFHLAYTGTAPTNAQCATFAADVRGAWVAHLQSEVIGQVELTETEVVDLTSPAAGIGAYVGADSGGAGGGSNPAANCVVIQGLIARRYRGGHPRLYFSYFGTGQLSGPQTWDPTYLGPFLTAWEAFQTAVQALTWATASITSAVNVSYFEGFTNFTFPSGRVKAIPKLRVGGPITDVITGWGANPNVASQRRRSQTP